MRFVRVFLNDDGAPDSVVESELPLGVTHLVDGVARPFVDLGLVMDYDATSPDGTPTTISSAIRQRLEKHPLAKSDPDAPQIRFAPEHADAPEVYFAPCGEKEIADHLRANGAERLPATTRAWLSMVLPEATSRALGLDVSVPVSVAKALERNRRGTIDGGRIAWLERETQKNSDARSARALATRQANEAAAAASAWAELQAAAAALEAADAPAPVENPPEEP